MYNVIMNEFEHFCAGHIVILIFLAYFSVSMCLYIAKAKEKDATRFIRFISILLLYCELFQEIMLTLEGGDLIRYLPFHLCNLGIFVNILAAFFKGKIRSFFAEVSLVLTGPGALFALITPDWNYRPLLSWLPVNCFFTHMLLVTLPVMMLIRGYCRPSFKHFHYAYLFLLVVTPPIYLFDIKYKTNYMFLRVTPEGTLLEWFESFMGNPGYLGGVLVLLALILIVVYSIALAVRLVKKHFTKGKVISADSSNS